MSEYRINVRFRLEDEVQRRAAEYMKQLDRGSRNAFAVKAICAYVDRLQSGDPNAELLAGFREILREELPMLPTTAPEPQAPRTLNAELTEAQKAANARNVLAALEGF